MNRYANLTLAAAALVMVAGAARAAEITLYTSMPKKLAVQTIEAYEAGNKGEKVKLFRAATGGILSKLRAEFAAGHPQADLVMIADEITMESLKAQGWLAAWPGAPVSGLPKGSYDRGMAYFGTKVMSTVLTYNTKSGKKPQSWKDLIAPANKGAAVMPNAVNSGAALANVAFLVGQPEFGWGYFKKLAANGVLVVRANGQVRDTVAGGARPLGMLLDYMAVGAKLKGSPIGLVYPKEGVTATYQPIAMLKGTDNPAAAKKFIAFLLSEKGQKLVAKQGYRPLRKDVPPPKGYPDMSSVQVHHVDPAASFANAEDLRKRFSDIFIR